MTQVADLADIVPSEDIEAALAPHLPPPLALALAWAKPVGKGSGNNVVIPRFDNITIPAGTKVESAEFALVATTTSSENMSGGWVGHADRVSWEADNHGLIQAVQSVVGVGVMHLRNRVDVDGLAELANATTDGNHTGVALTDDFVLEDVALFESLDPHETPGGRGIVLSVGQVVDWVQDLKANGGEQIGGDAESERLAKMMGIRQGYRGVRHGLQVFASNNVSTAGADANGAILQMGDRGALAYRVWSPIDWEGEWEPRRKAWMVTIAANYGWGLSDPDNIIGVISLAA